MEAKRAERPNLFLQMYVSKLNGNRESVRNVIDIGKGVSEDAQQLKKAFGLASVRVVEISDNSGSVEPNVTRISEKDILKVRDLFKERDKYDFVILKRRMLLELFSRMTDMERVEFLTDVANSIRSGGTISIEAYTSYPDENDQVRKLSLYSYQASVKGSNFVHDLIHFFNSRGLTHLEDKSQVNLPPGEVHRWNGSPHGPYRVIDGVTHVQLFFRKERNESPLMQALRIEELVRAPGSTSLHNYMDGEVWKDPRTAPEYPLDRLPSHYMS